MGRRVLGRLRSAAAVVAAVFVPALIAAQEPAPARSLSPADRPAAADTLPELLVEVSVERAGAQQLLGLQADTAVYLPLRAVLTFLEVRVEETVPGVRFAGRVGDGPAFAVRTAEGVATRGTDTWPLPAGAALWRRDELYVRLDVLAFLLDVEVMMQWPDLLVRIVAADELPLVRRIARERRRSVLSRTAESEPPVLLRTRSRVVDGLAVDWSLTAATRDPLATSALALGIGGTVLGGGLDVQMQVDHVRRTDSTPAGPRSSLDLVTSTFWQWNTAWTDRSWIRQLRLGDITTGGPVSSPIKGVEVTNRPFLRDPDFAVQDLRGRLPAGWEIEVYRSGELVGFQPVDSGGVYALPVPIVYGPNPLDVVAYGPNGEVRRSESTFLVGFERLPARQLEYSVSGGECPGGRCQAAVNADVRYGVSSRLTVQAGVQRFWRDARDTMPDGRDSFPDLTHPYGLVTFAVTRPLALTAEGIGGALARARFDFSPTPDLQVEGGFTRFDTSAVAPLVGSTAIRDQADGSLFWRPALLGGEFYVQSNAAWQRGALRAATQARIAGTVRVRGLRLTAGGRLDRRSERDSAAGPWRQQRSYGMDLGGDGVVTARGPWRNTLMRAAIGTDCVGASSDPSAPGPPPGCRLVLSRWDVGLGRQLLNVLRLDLAVSRERASPGLLVNITLQLATPWMRATSRNTLERVEQRSSADTSVLDTVTQFLGTQQFEGTILWDRRTSRLGFASGRNLGRAGIAGEVFLDSDGNGVRDGGDAALPGVLLRVGSDAVVTDSAGRFSVWDLVPYTDAIVEVDTLALENPLWVPAVAAARVVPVPNSFRSVEVPIRLGGEIEGRVELDGQPLPGVALVLREEATGRRRRVATFTDATFYVMRLPPGRYTLAPAEGLLEQLRARAAPVELEIGGAGLLRHTDVVVRIVRE